MNSFSPAKRSPWLLPLVPSYTIGIAFVVVLVGQDETLTLESNPKVGESLLHVGISWTGVFSVKRGKLQDGVEMFGGRARM